MNGICGIVLNFRTPAKTLACLESLWREAVTACVLVDNSEDGGSSLRAMGAGLERLHKAGMEITLVRPGQNLGFARGVNRALGVICERGRAHILLLNSDAKLQPGAVASLMGPVEREAALVAPMCAQPNGELVMPAGYYNRWFGFLSRRRLPGSFYYVSGACLLISEKLVKPNLMDEGFFFYGEDVALCEAVARAGRAIEVAPEGVVFHEGSGSARNGSLFYEYHINRWHMLMPTRLAKNRLQLMLQAAGRCLYLPLRALWRSWRARRLLPLKAMCLAASDVVAGRFRTLTPPADIDISK